MTAINRPTTPAFLSDNNVISALVQNNDESEEMTFPCTPPHRIPLCLSHTPLAPRPRKRVFSPVQFEQGDLDDLMMPCGLPDIPADDANEVEERPLPRFPLTARLAPARLLRRRLQSNMDGDEEAVVRLMYRQSMDDDFPEYPEETKENHNNGSGKLQACQAAPLNNKRRYSLGAQCA